MPPAPSARASRWPLVLWLGLAVWVAALIAGIVVVAATGGRPATLVGAWDEEVVRPGTGGGTIAVVEVTGEIVGGRSEDAFFGASQFGSDDYVSQLRQAMDDDRIDGVIVRLETPGGSVVASHDVYRAVRELREKKPVVALMGDVAASGGYYIAAGANSIVANRSTLTGSIGVIAFFPNLEGTADKLGVEPIVIKSGDLKDIGSPFRRMTRQERVLLQRLIDEAYEGFVDAVVEGRGMREADVRPNADGRVMSGLQAEDAGLVDRLGGLDEAIDEAVTRARIGRDPRVVRYVRPSFGLGDALFGVRSGRIASDLRSALLDAGRDVAGLPQRAGLHYLWLS